MCGFAGFTGVSRPDTLTRMGERIRHRGPDQDGRFEEPGISFIHARLSIVDLSEAGRQPMQTQDGRYTIVYNGELYNYRELRARYRKEGFVFHTETDTEVFLASAALHELCDLQDMHGMFAFVVWDALEKRLFAARDRMGIKPLYLARREGEVAFASEIKGLLPWTGPCRENLAARSVYLALGSIPGPETIFEGIESLEPGVLYTSQDGQEVRRSYLDLASTASERFTGSFEEACVQLRAHVDRAIGSQLMGDRPIGLFLSGGWDSSVIADAVRRAEPTASLKAFTVRFAHDTSDAKFNQDAEIARKTAEMLNFEHHEVTLQAQGVIDAAERVAWSLDQPVANHSVYALQKVSALACQHVPVVLSGDGGDESFGGYPRYALVQRMAAWMHIPAEVRRGLISLFSPFAWVFSHADALAAKDRASLFTSFHAPTSRCLRTWFPGVAEPFLQAEMVLRRKLLETKASSDVAEAFMDLDRRVWLRDDAFPRADRMTMLDGLEERVPLTDDALVAFAASLPTSMHVSRGQLKALWRQAFADRVHPDVHNLPKRGWFPPTAKWLRTGLRTWTEEIIEEALATHAWMDAPTIRRAYRDHLEKRGYYLNELWTVIGYQLWWRVYRKDLIV